MCGFVTYSRLSLIVMLLWFRSVQCISVCTLLNLDRVSVISLFNAISAIELRDLGDTLCEVAFRSVPFGLSVNLSRK